VPEDFIPNDGAVFDPSAIPAEQEKENREYINKAESSYPVINDLIKDFEQDIADADSITKLGITSAMPQIQVQIITTANEKYVEKLKTKLEALKAMAEAVKQ